MSGSSRQENGMAKKNIPSPLTILTGAVQEVPGGKKAILFSIPVRFPGFPVKITMNHSYCGKSQ